MKAVQAKTSSSQESKANTTGPSGPSKFRPTPGVVNNNRRGLYDAAPPVVRLPLQAKLVVGRPNDPYEREADAVADRVVSGGSAATISRLGGKRLAQRQEEPEQTMPVQRQIEEEPVQPQEEESVQPQAEEEPVQPQEEEPVQPQEEEPVQPQEEEPVQPQEEEPVQPQEEEPIQPSGGSNAQVPSATTATIRNPGVGQSLPAGVRHRIEPQVGANLSNVQVHTDAAAARAAGSLNARAFTHRHHIFLKRTESSSNLRLMAHEATHVVQQGSALAVQRMPLISSPAPDLQADFLSDIGSTLNRYARYIPGFTLFTVLIQYNPLTGETVERNAINLVQGLMELVPFGAVIFDTLQANGILNDAFDYVSGELTRFDLTRSRFERTLSAAADEILSFTGVFNAPDILEEQFGTLYRDVRSFAGSLVDHIIELIKEAAINLADDLLAENRAWSLIKKILGHDPLRGEEIEAAPAEILEDFLLLIGKEQELGEMKKRGTLEKTANWLATQISTFFSLLGELQGLFEAAWDMIRPQNLPNFASNLESLVQRAGSFLQRVWDFATTVAAKVLELIKEALLNWLKSFATGLPGYHLLTVILEKDVFTQERVPRTPTNLIRGFMSLLPGGEQQFQQMTETGVIPQAAARIETLMSELGISWPFIRDLVLGIWESLTIEDLIDPIGAFQRITDQFGEPIGRLFTFVTEVIKIVIELILQIMNFPLDIIQRIIANAMQAFEDIKRDPIQFLKNMLATVKLGFTKFFDNILQHLLSGVTEWLFSQVRKAGIEPPSEITLESMLDLALQILGVSMDQIWQKLADRIGQENVDRIRRMIDRLTGIWNFIRDVQERGLVAIWEYIQSQISNLFDMVMEQARNWIVTRVIERVVAKLLSMLDPTGIMAVVNSFMAFFNAVQSAIEYLREILLIIDDYVSTIAAVARGDIEPGAVRLEQGLANAIPVAVGFLANQVGLGNLSDKLAEIIAGVRRTIDRALDWLMDRAVRMGQAVLGALGIGGAGQKGAEGRLEKGFTDSSGSPHELTVKLTGTQPEIRVASPKPTGIQHQIQDRREAEKDTTNPRPLSSKQKSALTTAWNQHKQLVGLSRDYLKANATQQQPIQGKIKDLMDKLADNMVSGDAWPDTQIKPTQVIFSGSGGNKRVDAKPLTRRPGNTVGSAAADVIPGWRTNVPPQVAGRGGSLPWRRVHLLSDKLHGPGNNPANLIPAQEITNGELRRGPEHEAYQRITRGETLEYTARVTGVDPNNSFFPASPKGVHVTVKKIAPGNEETVFGESITTAPGPTGAAGPELSLPQLAVVNAYEQLEARLGRRPTLTEIANERGLQSRGNISTTISQIRELVKKAPRPLSAELQRAVDVLGL